jgi:hypothetical protein
VQRALHAIVVDPDVGDHTVAEALMTTAALGEKFAKIEELKRSLADSPRMEPGGVVAKAFDTILNAPAAGSAQRRGQ